MDAGEIERNLERLKFDTARERNVPAPFEAGVSRRSQDFIGTFIRVCLLVLGIAVVSAVQGFQSGRMPLLEIGVAVGIVAILVALFLRWRRRRQT
jgi:hypothetical protein